MIIQYLLSTKFILNTRKLKNSKLLNIYLKSAGIVVLDGHIKIQSNDWLLLVFKKGKNYIKIEINLKPLYLVNETQEVKSNFTFHKGYPPRDVDSIHSSITVPKFSIVNTELENTILELENHSLETFKKFTLISEDGREVKFNFEVESPAGFEVEIT